MLKKPFVLTGVLLFCAIGVVLYADNPHVPRGPIVVADQSFSENANVDVPTTVLFTPTSNGLFKVSVYIDITNGSGGFFPGVTMFWTDDFESTQTLLSIPANVASPGWGYSNFVLYDVANQPIKLNTVTNSSAQGVYNLYIVVEQL